MSLWGRLFERKQTATMTSADLASILRGQSNTATGESVTPRSALKISVGLACVRVIGQGLAQVPLKLYRANGDQRVAATDHPLYRLLYLKPNDWMTSYELRLLLAVHLKLCGEFFVWKNMVGGRVTELLPLAPGSVRKVREGWGMRYFYRLQSGGEQEIPAAEMWHMRDMTWDGFEVLSPVALVREALGLSLAAEQHGATMFANGLAIPGVLHSTQSLSEGQRKELRKSIEEGHTGANRFKMLITWGGLQYTPAASSNEDAQYLELRRFQVEEACRGFGVMPLMVYSSDTTQAYASVEAMFQAHLVHTMSPIYEAFQQSAMVNLLTDAELDAGYYIRLTVNALMHATAKDKAEYLSKLWNMGAINPNEVRELDERNPYPGGEKFRVPMNTETNQPGDSDATPRS